MMPTAVIQDEIFHAFDIRGIVSESLNKAEGRGLIRTSNTAPKLVLRFEAINKDNLQHLIILFRNEISRILPQLTIPF